MSVKKLTTRQIYNLVFPLACYFVFAYPVYRVSNWYGVPIEISLLESLVLCILGLAGMIYSFSGPKIIVRYFIVHWMGISFVFACLALVGEVFTIVFPENKKLVASTILYFGLGLVVFSILVSHHLKVKKIQIHSRKLSRPYRLVQISDVHIGSRQQGFMKRIVNRINGLEPDLVLITGDLIDSSAVNQEALQSLEELHAKVFFAIGNHERYADLEKILCITENLGIKTLRQETASFEELTISGIDDADIGEQVEIHLPELSLKKERFNLLLYHRPVGWEAAIRFGVDLMLSGHTHNGQIFPFNYLVKKQFARIKGIYQKGHHHLYVSPGTGTWGPLMRLGSMNEITLIELVPEA